jgi:hypothetical protein
LRPSGDGELAHRLADPSAPIEPVVRSGAASSSSASRTPAEQVADVLRRPLDGVIDVELRPLELGRLRLTFAQSEAGLHVLLAADRPDVLEMMRRQLDQLAQDLRGLGYERLSFSFEAGRGDGGGAMPQRVPETQRPKVGYADAAASVEVMPARGGNAPDTGLDLRL